MLAEMGASTWAEWKAFMSLTPFIMDQERADIRAAQIAMTLWNIAIAKGTKKGSTPESRHLYDFLTPWGDAPSLKPQQRPMTGEEQFGSIVDSFEALGWKPVKKE